MPQTQDRVNVNLIDVIDSIERAGKCRMESRGLADSQLLMVRERDLAEVYLEAADKAKEFFDKNEHPALRNYDRRLFDEGYRGLKSGSIKVCVLPGSE
jgi:hypothetical protein